MSGPTDLPVVVIGGGPVGLAAAAHLVSRGIRPIVIERGDAVAANVRSWGHVLLFSPWRYDIDRTARSLLEKTGWSAPDDDRLPTGKELVDEYLRPLSRLPAIAEGLLLRTRVVAVARKELDLVKTKKRNDAPFVVRVEQRGDDGWEERDIEARAVIDASGTWANANPIGSSGLPAVGERDAQDRIAYGIPDVLGAEREVYAGRTTLVVGAGHSAANAILALAKLATSAPDTRIIWTTRGEDLRRAFGGGAADGLPARGQLGADLERLVHEGALTLVTGWRIHRITREGDRLTVVGGRGGATHAVEGIDRIIAATGQRPDLSILREVRVELDPALECTKALGPLIDPNEHSCGTVRPHGAVELAHPERDLYVIGNKSYGRAPTFLLATGYEQARSVVAMIAGDREAALRVELDLPETGVCEVRRPGQAAASGSCCGPATVAAACC